MIMMQTRKNLVTKAPRQSDGLSDRSGSCAVAACVFGLLWAFLSIPSFLPSSTPSFKNAAAIPTRVCVCVLPPSITFFYTLCDQVVTSGRLKNPCPLVFPRSPAHPQPNRRFHSFRLFFYLFGHLINSQYFHDTFFSYLFIEFIEFIYLFIFFFFFFTEWSGWRSSNRGPKNTCTPT